MTEPFVEKKEMPVCPGRGKAGKKLRSRMDKLYLNPLFFQVQNSSSPETPLFLHDTNLPAKPRTEAEINKHIICVCLRIIKRANARITGDMSGIVFKPSLMPETEEGIENTLELASSALDAFDTLRKHNLLEAAKTMEGVCWT